MFDFLYKPVQLDKPIENSLYVRENDRGEWMYTPLFQYKMASHAKEFFKSLILQMDNDKNNLKYTTYVTKTKINYDETEQNKSQYAAQYEQLNKQWEDYRKSHRDEFDEQPFVYSGDEEEVKFVSRFSPQLNYSLRDAVQGYLCASELLKQFGKGTEGHDSLPKLTKLVSKPDMRAAHEQMRKIWQIELGIPDDSQLTVQITEEVHQMKRFSKADSTITTDEPLEDYSKEFSSYVIER